MNLKLFISDLDGTILETEDYHRLAYNALFNELGLKQTWSKQDYVARLQTMGGNKFREIFEWMKLPEDEYRETKVQLYQRKTELYVELITRDLGNGTLGLRPGIVRFFTEVMEAGIPTAIATACVGWAAEKVVEAALGEQFLHSLAAFCGGESTPRHKPAPDIYLLAAKRASVPTSACAVLEDTSHGMRAAKDAGMICVVTPSEFAKDHDFTDANLVLKDLETPKPFTVQGMASLF